MGCTCGKCLADNYAATEARRAHPMSAQRTPESAEPVKRFTIMGGPSIPWRWLAPHEAQAKKNHGGQDLVTLYNRGGLSPYEALRILEDLPLTKGGHWPDKDDDRAARDELQRRIDADEVVALEARLASAEAERDSIQHQEIVAAQVEFNAMRERAIAAEEERDAYRKAWELPDQPITQGIVPSAGEAAANAVEHAKIYKGQRDAANAKLEAAEAALKTAIEALEKIASVPRLSTPRVVIIAIASAALKQVREQQGGDGAARLAMTAGAR